MAELDLKWMVIGGLLLLLVAVKLLARRPYDQPVRRRRGARSERYSDKAGEPPEQPEQGRGQDPEKEFFGEDKP